MNVIRRKGLFYEDRTYDSEKVGRLKEALFARERVRCRVGNMLLASSHEKEQQ